MPLITPADLKAYSTFHDVKMRADSLLEKDILEAELEIEALCGHAFQDPKYVPLPPRVQLAAEKLAQYYALLNSDEDLARNIKQERHENYSYTRGDGVTIQKPDISRLLAAHVIIPDQPKRSTKMRMRVI